MEPYDSIRFHAWNHMIPCDSMHGNGMKLSYGTCLLTTEKYAITHKNLLGFQENFNKEIGDLHRRTRFFLFLLMKTIKNTQIDRKTFHKNSQCQKFQKLVPLTLFGN